MNKLMLAAMLAATLPTTALLAQELTSTSGSASDANSASNSGAAAISDQGQTQSANNAGIGNSTSTSNSGANANSSTSSGAAASATIRVRRRASRPTTHRVSHRARPPRRVRPRPPSRGTSRVSRSTRRPTACRGARPSREFRTNTAVPLAASSSFSSDYCGGTASGGASAAPLGISIGGAGPVFDKSCQSLRRAEKFGMAAANYNNMGQPDYAMRMMSMMVWSICTADSQGPKGDASTASACLAMAMLGGGSLPPGARPQPLPPIAPTPPTPEAKITNGDGTPTPEAVQKATDDARTQKISMLGRPGG